MARPSRGTLASLLECLVALLELFGPHAVWQPAARLGLWSPEQGPSREVGVLVGPEGATPESLGKARERAAGALHLRARGVLPLLDVVLVQDRLAWVYDKVDAVGLSLAVGSDAHGTMLSTRAAAEVVAEVAEVLVSTGPLSTSHPGPEPTDLLLDRRGRLSVLGFVGPFAPSPSMRAPNLGTSSAEAAQVYRLGVLLAHLVSGVPPTAPTERSAHPALIRRALIRAMARPGPVLTERYGDWLRGMLAWEPSARPPLSSIASGLRKVGEATGGPDLVDWADAFVEDLGSVASQPPPRPTPAPAPSPIVLSEIGESQATEEVPKPTEVDLDDFPEDEDEAPTVVHTEGAVGMSTLDPDDATQEGQAFSRPPPQRTEALAGMPVTVGPPPEAMRRSPRLPEGFLDSGTAQASSQPATQGGGGRSARWSQDDPSYWLWPALMAMAIAGLALLALVLLALVVLSHAERGAAAQEGPSLEEALPLGEPPAVHPSPPPVEAVLEVEQGDLPSSQDLPAPQPEEGSLAPEPPPSQPLMAPAEPVEGPFVVVFRGIDPSASLAVDCNEASGEGVGRVELVLQQRGPCVVTSDLDDQRLRAHVSVAGPSELTCFAGDRSVCR